MQQFIVYLQNHVSLLWALIAACVVIILLIIALIVKTMSYKKPKIKEETDDFWLKDSAAKQPLQETAATESSSPVPNSESIVTTQLILATELDASTQEPPEEILAENVSTMEDQAGEAPQQELPQEEQPVAEQPFKDLPQVEPYAVEAVLAADQTESVQSAQEENKTRLSEKELYDLVEALSSRDEAVAMNAVSNLREYRDLRALPYLVAALMLPTLYIPARVGEALAAYGRQTSELLLRLIPQISTEGKISALQVLGIMDVVIELEKIEPYLKDEDAKIRELAVACLGNCQEKDAVDAALAATHDEVWQVRASAARVLQKRGDPSAYFRLREMEKDEAWWVQEAAKEATHDIEMN